MNITLIADTNIANINDYFPTQISSKADSITFHVIKVSGRDITSELIQEHSPDALLVRSVTKVNSELLLNNTSVKFVGSATIGTDHIDQQYLANKGITFANAAGCSKHSVAQYVITALHHLQPTWFGRKDTTATKLTIGIVGLGNIGFTLAKYALSLGWSVLAYDPLLSSQQQEQLRQKIALGSGNNMTNSTTSSNFEFTELETLLKSSDAISLHVPLTTKEQSQYPTYHLIDETALNLMKTDTIVINSARGQVIKETALLADMAVTNRNVVLDVFEHEPVVAFELLAKLAIATPHIAGYTLEGKLRGTQMIYEAFCDVFKLQKTQNIEQLLPTNPYRWFNLQSDFEQFTQFYNILGDDALLRNIAKNAATDTKTINGSEFDALRKNYQLRREWI